MHMRSRNFMQGRWTRRAGKGAKNCLFFLPLEDRAIDPAGSINESEMPNCPINQVVFSKANLQMSCYRLMPSAERVDLHVRSSRFLSEML